MTTDAETRPGTAYAGGTTRGGVVRSVYTLYLVLVMVATAVLPFDLARYGHTPWGRGEHLVALVIVAASVLNVEIGRLVEGGVSGSQRPHKALSAWAFACSLLLPTWWLPVIVAFTYVHAWWRGLRVPVWKWVGSGAYLVLCGTVAAVTSASVVGGDMRLTEGSGLRGLTAVLGAAAAFLALETVLFHGSAYLNRPESEVWLRKTLRSGSFYLTEGAVLVVGGLSAAIWTDAPWLLVLLTPIFGLTQRAVLHEPLRERADGDEKTGVLRFDAWQRLARASVQRCVRRGEPWSVLFLDIDHFKRFNDIWGHLAGDRALVAVAGTVAELVAGQPGPSDPVGRFGGEEFCVLRRGPADRTAALAEQVRRAVAELALPGVDGLTISIGVATVAPGVRAELETALEEADRALFEAKGAGRNSVAVRIVRPA